MKLTGLSITSFGRFQDLELSRLSEGIVVVFGPNEAGKSTFCSLLQALLYGFRPVSGFLYHSWQMDRPAEMRGSISLGCGEEISVWRRLASSPQGQLSRNGRSESLGNRELPFLGPVNRELYQALYGLTQENVRSLDSSQQQEIEDRLLGGLGPEVLRPARQIASQLESRAAKLWRPDNRGRPEFKTLRESLRQARQKRREAVEQDASLRYKSSRLEELDTRIRDLEEELIRISSLLRQADFLLPIKNRLDQIEEWKRDIFDLEAVESLPAGVESEHARLCKDLESRRSRLEELHREQQKEEGRLAALTSEDQRLLDSAEEIHAWYRYLAVHEQEARRLQDLQDNLLALRRELGAQARRIASPPFNGAWLQHLRELSLQALKAKISRLDDLQVRLYQLELLESGSGTRHLSAPIPARAALLVQGLGAALCAAGFFRSALLPLAGGGLLFLAGTVMGIFNLAWKRQLARFREASQAAAGQENRQDILAASKSTREEIAVLLSGLHISAELLEQPDLELYRALSRLQELLSRLLAEKRQASRRHRRWQQEQEQLQGLLDRFSEDHGPESLTQLLSRLREAEQRLRDSRRAEERLRELEREIEAAQADCQRTEREIAELSRSLARATGCSEKDGAQAAREGARLQGLAQRIRELESKLQSEHPDLPELKREMQRIEESRDQAWMFRAEEVERARQKKENILQELQDLKEERAGLQRDLAHGPSVGIGELDGEIGLLQERMREVCTERDRLILLSNILRSAEQSFRERHQPDVLQRCSEYVRFITQGRYDQLSLFEDEAGAETLHIRDQNGVYHPMQPPLSSGTLDQIHLAFRLAVIDHLDAGQESLPLVLDEILINWDDARFERGLELLSRISQRRQIFLCTCRRSVAEAVSNLPRASLLALDPVEEAP